ncbi:MAG: zinc-binding dehydrogenase, partial [Armatimonadetes bacterium]|nr:zinc-binding dehydrogenase [Armatimonadota bacterium]
IQPGDHVVSSNLFGDWAGDYCVAWAGHLEYLVYSKTSHQGLSSKRAVKIPEGVPLEHAGIALLGAIAYHGVHYKIDPQPDETVLVIGMGAIGQMAAQECKAAGARVIVADICQNRLDVAAAWGADGTINAAESDLWGELAGMVESGEPQAIIEVTGEPDVLEDVLNHAPQHCRIQAQGMYLEPISLYIPKTLFGRHLTLSATCGEKPFMVEAVLDLMASGQVDVSGLVTDIMPAAEATEAYRRIYEQPDEVVTLALDWRDF